jgi:glucose-fructose oxidoreductase
MNMGVYAIQGAIYAAGEPPISVMAQEFSTKPDYFNDTDETITAQFEFPSGTVGSIFTSHNAKADRLYASCDKGWYELDVAYTYGPLHGRTSKGKEIQYPQHKRQQALQMDDFAMHILQGTPNKVPGSMGLRDLTIVEAIYQSIEHGGKKIMLHL